MNHLAYSLTKKTACQLNMVMNYTHNVCSFAQFGTKLPNLFREKNVEKVREYKQLASHRDKMPVFRFWFTQSNRICIQPYDFYGYFEFVLVCKVTGNIYRDLIPTYYHYRFTSKLKLLIFFLSSHCIDLATFTQGATQ